MIDSLRLYPAMFNFHSALIWFIIYKHDCLSLAFWKFCRKACSLVQCCCYHNIFIIPAYLILVMSSRPEIGREPPLRVKLWPSSDLTLGLIILKVVIVWVSKSWNHSIYNMKYMFALYEDKECTFKIIITLFSDKQLGILKILSKIQNALSLL